MEVLGRQEDVLSSIACLEKSRLEIVQKIAEHLGEDPVTLNVTKLSEIVGEDLKKELDVKIINQGSCFKFTSSKNSPK